MHDVGGRVLEQEMVLEDHGVTLSAVYIRSEVGVGATTRTTGGTSGGTSSMVEEKKVLVSKANTRYQCS